MTVIIIEDEPLMAAALEEELAHAAPDIEVVKCLDSVQSAIEYLNTNKMPDLFFSDIQLGDGLSFEIFRAIKSSTPVIFCTAYDEYALEAFKLNGIDYILKPFDTPTIKATLEKYFNLTQKQSTPAPFDPEQLLTYFGLHDRGRNASIIVYQGEKIIPVKKNHLAIIFKKDGITYAITFDQKKYVLEQNLDELEQELGHDFFRANRQILVHREAIKEVVKYFARKLIIQPNVAFPDKIVVSKAKAPSFIDWLKQH